MIPVLGAIASAGIFIALSANGLPTREAGAALVRADRMMARAGLGLDRIEITGLRNARESDVFGALDQDRRRSIVMFDSSGARQRIEQLSWVRSATLTRQWPNTLVVAIVERRPAAIWRQAGRDQLVDTEGRVLGAVGSGAVGSLIVVTGETAAAEFSGLRPLIERHPALAEEVVAARWVDGRRWTLVLTRGREMHLPAVEPATALDLALAGGDGRRLIDLDFLDLDLRVAGRVLVRQARRKPAQAAAPRAERQAIATRTTG